MFFPGGIESTANASFLLSLAAAVIYGLIVNARTSLLLSVLKTMAVGLLAVLAFVEGGPWLLVGALALSSVGDLLLSRDGDRPFLAGLCSFLAAHALYIALFWLFGGGVDPLATALWRAGLAAVFALAGLVMFGLLWRRVPPGMRLPILAYVVAIVVMGIAALTLGNLWIIAGAVLFMLSDGLLASEKFLASAISPHRNWMRTMVWVLYYAAQVLITLGFLLG